MLKSLSKDLSNINIRPYDLIIRFAFFRPFFLLKRHYFYNQRVNLIFYIDQISFNLCSFEIYMIVSALLLRVRISIANHTKISMISVILYTYKVIKKFLITSIYNSIYSKSIN